MKLLGKIIGVVILCFVLLFLGTCYFQNCREDKPDIDIPEAKYRITVIATGNVYFSNNVVVLEPDPQVVLLKGYWENVKGKYVYKNIEPYLELREEYFGEIEVRKVAN